jgi:hypothetical protein
VVEGASAWRREREASPRKKRRGGRRHDGVARKAKQHHDVWVVKRDRGAASDGRP